MSQVAQRRERYKLHEQLGIGTMGIVYRATDRLTGDIIALKQVHIHKSNIASEDDWSKGVEFRLALAQEFRLLASLRHPHIISVLDYGFDANQQPFFTMNLLKQAQSIVEYGEHESEEGKVRLLTQTLQALTYLHRRDVIHRDLKPANIMVTGEGQVKVLDFGLSGTADQVTGQAGTLAYMAPEVLLKNPMNRLSDLYAVGMIAYELFVGNYPFRVDNPMLLIRHIVQTSPDVSMLGNPDLQNVLLRWLMKSAEDRYQTSEEIIKDLCDAVKIDPPQESIKIRESFLQAARLIGRENELSQLRHAFQQAQEGQGSVWLIGGESGVGKSRIVEELRTMVLVNGATVLRGQGVDGGGLPYQLWRTVLPMLLLLTDVDKQQASILKEIVPNIELLLESPVDHVAPLMGREQQLRLILTIIDIFKQQKEPMLVLLEDLQWTQESLEPLKYLLKIVKDLPLLIVATYRDDERPELPEILSGANHLHLNRLKHDEVALLSEAMLGNPGTSPEVVDFLNRETEGNIFFLVEVVHALIEDAGGMSKIGRQTLPEQVFTGGIQKIVRRRLSKLSEEMGEILQLSAIIGREIDADLLLVHYDANMVEKWLLEGSNAAVLSVQDNVWRFAHDKLREEVLNNIGSDEKPLLYYQVAIAIETIYPDDKSRASILAQYWHVAGDSEKELYYTKLATEHALLMNDFRGALVFNQYTQTLIPHESAHQIKVLLQAGYILFQLSEYDEAREYLQEGLIRAQKFGDMGSCATALNYLGSIARERGNYSLARNTLENSLSIARESTNPLVIARVLLDLGWTEFRTGDFASARSYFAESVEIYETYDDRRGLANALNRLGGALLHLHQYEEAKSLRVQSLTICQELGDRFGQAIALANLGEGERLQGNYEAARPYYLSALDIYRVIGAQNYVGIALTNLGQVALSCNNLDEAIGYFKQSLQVATKIGGIAVLMSSLIGLIEISVDMHHEERALKALGFVLNHQELGIESREQAMSALNKLRSMFPDDIVQAELERGKSLNMDMVLADILSIFGEDE